MWRRPAIFRLFIGRVGLWRLINYQLLYRGLVRRLVRLYLIVPTSYVRNVLSFVSRYYVVLSYYSACVCRFVVAYRYVVLVRLSSLWVVVYRYY